MGYFSNGTEGHLYQERYCSRCIHEDSANEKFCPIWNAHLIHNREGANNPDHILHMLIPINRDDSANYNGQCHLFVHRTEALL